MQRLRKTYPLSTLFHYLIQSWNNDEIFSSPGTWCSHYSVLLASCLKFSALTLFYRYLSLFNDVNSQKTTWFVTNTKEAEDITDASMHKDN